MRECACVCAYVCVCAHVCACVLCVRSVYLVCVCVCDVSECVQECVNVCVSVRVCLHTCAWGMGECAWVL
jgi:hypothetical protein